MVKGALRFGSSKVLSLYITSLVKNSNRVPESYIARQIAVGFF